MDNFLKKGWRGEEVCVFCMDEPETVHHLSVGCETTRLLLKGQLPSKTSLIIAYK